MDFLFLLKWNSIRIVIFSDTLKHGSLVDTCGYLLAFDIKSVIGIWYCAGIIVTGAMIYECVSVLGQMFPLFNISPKFKPHEKV